MGVFRSEVSGKEKRGKPVSRIEVVELWNRQTKPTVSLLRVATIAIAIAGVMACATVKTLALSGTETLVSGKQKAKKKAGAKSAGKHKAKRHSHRRASTARSQKIRRAFVASGELKPIARQLIETRNPAAYAGVEGFAQRHTQGEAGAMAWLVLGYVRLQDKQYEPAIAALVQARARDGELADYSTYFLAQAYGESRDFAKVQATLSQFATKYSDSLFQRDADLLSAQAELQLGKPTEAISRLGKYRADERAAEGLVLGRAYVAVGQNAKALSTLRHIYYAMPLAAEADAAEAEMRKLGGVSGSGLATLAERRTRAELLAKGRRYEQAAREYHDLLAEAPVEERPAVQVQLSEALRKAGHYKEAREVLDRIPETESTGVKAQRLYQLLEVARSLEDEPTMLAKDTELRVSAPTSSWLEEALLSTANYYLLKNDIPNATRYYREIYDRFPRGAHGSYAHWKAAWLTLRQGKHDDAAAQMEEQIQVYGATPETPAALYWRARLAEEESDFLKAHAFLRKLADRYQNFYYGEQARRELARLQMQGTPQPYAVLQKIGAAPTPPDLTLGNAPLDSLRLERAHLLENAGLVEFAVRELSTEKDALAGNWFTLESARLYADSGRYDRSIELMKREVPGYFTFDLESIQRPYWELLFPKPYWSDLSKYAGENGLDPYLTAALIRQESEFYAGAVSKANAIGLMQMLPGTGKQTAKSLGLRSYTADQLYQPGLNLQLGTKYFKGILDHFGGNIEFSLAAYNAGQERVEQWRSTIKFKDSQEFVESIPFTETREYVQAILRNVGVYKRLYAK